MPLITRSNFTFIDSTVKDGWTRWKFEVVYNGRVWNVTRIKSPDGTQMDVITAKDNVAYQLKPTSAVATAIGWMVDEYFQAVE